MRKSRGVRVSAGDHSPEAYRALRSWLRFRRGRRGDFDRYLVQSARRRTGAPADVRRRSRTIAKGLAVVAVGSGAVPTFDLLRNDNLSDDGLVFLAIAVVTAALAIWSWRVSS
jgi:hypothetical protein